MSITRNMTIKRKLMLIIMLTCTIALLLADTLNLFSQRAEIRKELIHSISCYAQIIGENCRAAISFEDANDASEMLASLKAKSSIVFACVYTKEGKVLARYRRPDITEDIPAPPCAKESCRFDNHYFKLFRRIDRGDEVIGTVYIQLDTSEMKTQFRREAGIMILSVLMCSLVAYLVSLRLQRVISGPIVDLAEVARVVSEKKDYSIRAVKQNNDEVGLLIDAFNTMLEQIQNRESDLREARDKLEERVVKRTTELTYANEQLISEITERKNIETALRKGEERFRQVVESAGDWIWEVNAEGLYTYASPIVERVLGYKPEEIVGKKHFYDFFAPDVKEILKKAAFEVIAKGEVFKGFVNLNIHKNGSTVIMETSGIPIIDEKGNLCGYRGADRDITERKRAEVELKTTQEKLFEVARKAGMAEVAADVLHNVGNVLNSINVSATVITEKVTKSELANVQKVASIINEHIDEIGTFLAEHPRGKHIPVYLTEVSKCLQAEQSDIIGKLQVLTDNVQHIKDIISMQQAYAKVSGIELQVSLRQLVEDAIRINSAGLQRHRTRLVREFDELPDVEIDKQRLLQILVNLISNAKYALSDSDKEDKLLTIRIYRRDEDRFRIEVADNGAGIPKENLTKIFRHGFTTKQHGHGFGLHSSALGAKELGGSLTVHSDGLGKGARFTLELPFKPARVTQ